MKIVFSEGSGLNDSIYGKCQAPIRMFLEQRGEQFEQQSVIKDLFLMGTSDNYGDMMTTMTAMEGFQPVGENGAYPADGMQEGYNKMLIYETWKDSFAVSREMIEDGKLLDMKKQPAAFMTSYQAMGYATPDVAQTLGISSSGTNSTPSGNNGGSAGNGGNSGGGKGGSGYDNGGLTSAQIKELQKALGVTADGKYGPKSSKAAGGLSAEEAYKKYVAGNGTKSEVGDVAGEDAGWEKGIDETRNLTGMKGSAWDYTKNTVNQLIRAGDKNAVLRYVNKVVDQMSADQYDEVMNLLVGAGIIA